MIDRARARALADASADVDAEGKNGGPALLGLTAMYFAAKLFALAMQRVEAIEDAIESHGVKYVGVWQRSGEYERGNLATHDGSMWHAVKTTRDEPGTSDAWQLAVKAGRNGRDAR